MRAVRWWGVISAVAAPVLLIGGWTVAASLQPRFDPVADTVSTLAAIGATDRWVMNLTFLLVGACYIATALALRAARTPGRLVLIGGAIAGMLVAFNPEHAGGFGSVPHFVWASIGFAGLTTWPAWAWRRGTEVPWGLRPAPSIAAVAVQFALLAWFGTELILAGHQVGLAERVVGAAQAGWPLTVVLSCWRPRSPARVPATALRWPHAGQQPRRRRRPPGRVRKDREPRQGSHPAAERAVHGHLRGSEPGRGHEQPATPAPRGGLGHEQHVPEQRPGAVDRHLLHADDRRPVRQLAVHPWLRGGKYHYREEAEPAPAQATRAA